MISFEKVYKKFTASYSRSNSPDHNQSGFTLKNLNFQIDTGECVAVIGSNGSGKSTLLKLISSVYKPDGGRVKVIGTCSPIINAGQFFDDEMDLIENINLYGTFSDYKSIDIPVEDIIQKSGLNEYSGLPIKYFSTGMIARASFSIGTAFDFDTYLIDEVFSVGDTAFNEICINTMEKLKKCKKTLLFVTHDLELATGFADKVIVLNRGKLLFFGDTKTGVEYYLEGSKEKIFSLRKETFQFQDYLLKMAGLLEKKGDMAKAEKYFVKILKSHTNVENLKRAGWFYKKWGKLSKSFEYFKKALELSPKDIECRNELIDNLGISGNRSELCDFLRFSLKATPEDLSLHSQIIFHGEPDEVLKAAEQIFMLNLENNEDINLLLKVASVFEKNEDYYKTERILIRVLKLNPELHDANLLLANIEYLRKKFDCSIKICDKLINDNPEERNAYIIKMRCIFENSGDCIELVNHCNIMIDRFSGLQEFMLILRCTHEMGNSKKFDEYLSHFHEYFPEFKNLFKKIL